MEYRRLGNSDVEVSVITFGAWAIGGWMWGGQDDAEAIAAIQTSIDSGVTSIDTAAIYGYGHSEQLVAKAIEGKRQNVQILTKFGLRWDCQDGEFRFEWTDSTGATKKVYSNSRKESVIHECEQSLKRLGTDYIDLYQCHRRDKTTPVPETMEALDKLLKDGKIRAAGVSNYGVEDIEAANKVVPIASHQPPYSMVCRHIEKDSLPYCREHNIGVIVYSPLERGLLTGKFTEDHEFKGDDHRAESPFFRPENIRKVNAFLEEIRPIAEAHDATLAQLVINWTIHRPGVTAALVGARNPKQAAENAKAADFVILPEETSRIDELLEEHKLDV